MKEKISKKARVIAYYLPQFHPIPENDEWWGKGFTEWTNVGRAKPLFKGHNQPRVPADLGYYDLRIPEIREAQAEMAINAGIEGFMYWHYWFGNGRKILELPFNEVLKSGKPDFPFCLGWANHSWNNGQWNAEFTTKRIALIEQTYLGKKDYENHFHDVLPAFLDNRYIKIDNKPIFNIYAPNDIPDKHILVDTWNNLAINHGLNGIYFIGIDKLNYHQELMDAGFNGINSSRQWHAESMVKGKWKKIFITYINKKSKKRLLDTYSYSSIIKHLFDENDKKENFFPTIIPQWDRSPRGGKRSVIYYGSTPELFNKHLKTALKLIEHKKDEHKILFLKSWNEWGESNYVEPDLKFGHGYLNVIRKNILDI